MGNWYKVIKRINGRLYGYWQRTERHGKHVKTFNKYIGPAGTPTGQAPSSAPTTNPWNRMTSAQRYNYRTAKIMAEVDTLTETYGDSSISLEDKAQSILNAVPDAPRSEAILYARKITELTGAEKVTAAAMLEALQYATDRERLFGKQVYIYALFDKDMVSLANYRRAEMIGVSGLDPELPTLTEAVNARIRALGLTKRRADDLRRYILHEYGDYLNSDKLRKLQTDQSYFFMLR